MDPAIKHSVEVEVENVTQQGTYSGSFVTAGSVVNITNLFLGALDGRDTRMDCVG